MVCFIACVCVASIAFSVEPGAGMTAISHAYPGPDESTWRMSERWPKLNEEGTRGQVSFLGAVMFHARLWQMGRGVLKLFKLPDWR